MPAELLEVRQLLEQVRAAQTDLPDGLIDRLISLLERDSPDRVQSIKTVYKEAARG